MLWWSDKLCTQIIWKELKGFIWNGVTQHSDLRRKEPLYEVNQTNTVKFILDHILTNGEGDENNEVNTTRHQKAFSSST